MKKQIFTILACLFASGIMAQSNVSMPMSFKIEKDVVPPMLNIVPNSQTFVDKDKNGVIDANENCAIRFEISNDGAGDAYGCVARLTASGAGGLVYNESTPLPVIPHGTKQWIEVPIRGGEDLQTGELQFSIVIDEPNGFGTDPITGVIGTHKLRAPFIQVASYKIVGAKGGKLNRRETFKLQVIVQNTDQGTAENVTVGLQLPENVNWTGGSEEFVNIGTLKPNETKTFEYELLANQRAADQIDIQVALAESYGRFAKNADIPLQFGQYVGSSIAMNVERKDEENPTMNEGVISFLKSLGAEHKGFTKMIAETTQPRFNAEMDVDPDYYSKLDRKTIRSIETAKKKGTEVYTGHEYLQDFCTAMHYTEVRKKIALRNEEYFRNMMEVYGDNALCMVAKLNLKKQMDMLESRIAEHEEALKGELTRKQKGIHERGLAEDTAELEKLKADRETAGEDEMILCGILACYNRNMMEIFYMGNNPNAMRIRASYLLYNKCIEFCAEHGIHECSFGGMEGTLDDGLTVFKSNFLMNVEEAIPYQLMMRFFHGWVPAVLRNGCGVCIMNSEEILSSQLTGNRL